MKKYKFGVFTHYLYGNENWVQTTNDLDIKHLAANIAKTGASYYFITIMQGWRYMLAPNETFDKIAGTAPGEACSVRDVPMELADELEKYGIKLCLYYTGDGPHFEPEIGPKFEITEPRWITKGFVDKWAAVLREYSLRYGKKVAAWWIDGCYEDMGYTNELLKPLYDAAKAGNPDAYVTLNNGCAPDLRSYYYEEDYTAGEYVDFVYVPSKSDKIPFYGDKAVNGMTYTTAKKHILAPLGVAESGIGYESWLRPGLKCNAEHLADYIKKLAEVDTTLTIDIYISPDGTFDEVQLNELARVSEILEKD